VRTPDIAGPHGEAWKVPLDRLTAYVAEHHGDIHPASRGDLFEQTWRDVWYVRRLELRDLDQLTADWVAVVLRDLRSDPGIFTQKMYEQAEWDLTVYHCDPSFGTPPLNGEALFEWDQTREPTIIYQFHGLTEAQVLRLGRDPRRPITFAQYLVEAICRGSTRSNDETWSHRLSGLVNGIRQMGLGGEPSRRPLEVAARTGLLLELEDGSTVSLPGEALLPGDR
jgi:hypothetical protein